MRLTDKKIEGLELSVRIDPTVNGPLLQLLKLHGFESDDLRHRLNELIPEFDGSTYRAGIKEVRRGPTGMFRMADITHQGIHYLGVLKYGFEIQGRPLFTMLNECVGIPLDVEFVAQLVRRSGADKHSLGLYRQYLDNISVLGTKDINRFELICKAPFRCYREMVLEIFDFFVRTYELVSRKRTLSETDVRRLLARLQKTKYLCFYFHYNFILPPVFVAAHCGKSTPKDRQIVNDCIEQMRRARSMADFLVRLGLEDELAGTA